MYAVKVFHGYIDSCGRRTRKKEEALIFYDIGQAEQFAKKIGGRVKELMIVVEKSEKTGALM
ncbi:hypothetical protein I6N96_03955 [Enterococcus sp. BWM-S5]|uniref:Uncharacterized protein n=1 Tax=Enterococcus larvae TaxID=2794352 RepID=A0ABS4CFJ8_9ENTE|nr:hypothetical protein [Enterococcus larvae]